MVLAFSVQILTLGFASGAKLKPGEMNKGSETVKNDGFSINKTVAVDITVTGTVTDSNGESIPGVTVFVPGTTTGTATDLMGKYSITVPDGATLSFSYIGYVTQTIYWLWYSKEK